MSDTRAMTAGDNAVGCSTGNPPEADLRRGKGSTGKVQKRRKKAFVPTKGGDGGTPAPVKRGANWAANGLVVLTGASIRGGDARAVFESVLVETTDPSDRAHNEKKLAAAGANPRRDDSWVLCTLGEIDLPGARPRSRPRRYHPSQVVGRVERDADGVVLFDNRVGLDSMFDHAARDAQRLEDAGIEMGWHTTRVGECSRMEQALRHRYEGMDWHAVRDAVEQKTTQEMITREDIGDG